MTLVNSQRKCPFLSTVIAGKKDLVTFIISSIKKNVYYQL